jgi:hypothetical protein
MHIPVPPNCAINLGVNNDYPICPGGTNLTWENGGLAPSSFDVYFGTDPEPAFAGNTTEFFYPTGALSDNTTYYYKIVPKNADGDATGCDVISFTTGDNLNCYCVPENFGCGNGDITNVNIGTIDNTTGCSGDVAYSAVDPSITTDLQIGTSPALSVTTNQSCIVSVWVDWNQDLIFAPEEWQQVTTSSTIGVPSVIALTIPNDALLGTTVMRIRSRFANNINGDINSCDFFGSGEAEDYRVNVTAPDVSWGGLSSDYCVNGAPSQLFPTTPGGVFSGPGVSLFGFGIYIFDPAVAGIGTHTITYAIGAYTNDQSTTVHDLPVVTLEAFADVCINDAAFTLTGGSPVDGIPSFYTIDENGAEIFDPATWGVGTHTITYYYYDAYGCSNSASQSITVNDATNIYYADNDGDGYGTGDPIYDCTQPANTATNNTDCDDAAVAVNPGMAEVCSNGIDDNCDFNIDENDIVATVEPGGTIIECAGYNVTLTANYNEGYTYQWYKSSGIITSQTTNVITTNRHGNYYVVESNGICSATSATTIISRILSPNIAKITLVNGDLNLCTTGSVTMRVYESTNLYQWYKTGLPISGATTRQYVATGTGDYNCVITGPNGCTSSSDTKTAYTSGCKLGDGSLTITEELNIYPNPATNNFTVLLNTGNNISIPADIQLVNVLGQIVLVQHTSITDGKLSEEIIPGNSIASGNYFVKIVTSDNVYSTKIVYQK